MRRCGIHALSVLALILSGFANAEDLAPDSAKLNAAIAKGLGIVQKAASNYPSHRSCFSCHHQTLPMLAMMAARNGGAGIDEKLFQAQADFSHKSFSSRRDEMKEGKGIGGRAFTVGYGLWALDLAGRKSDETTDAMVAYLIKIQKDDGHWEPQTVRPPLEESRIACTALAVNGMQKYGAAGQQKEVKTAIEKAKTWMSKANPTSHEDYVARLWGLVLTGASEAEVASARKAILQSQHEDGGWSQLPPLASDAYATGQAMVVLKAFGGSDANAALQRGTKFLLRTQRDDGSWLVETRSKPVQTFFDNGDPHGKHQFISVPATSWAVAALAVSQAKVKTVLRP